MEALGRLERHEVYYQGDVQGVGFRYTTRRLASRWPVTGYVRNEPDGRVLVVVEGTGEVIRQFLGAVEEEFEQYIRGKQAATSDPAGQFHNFDIRF